MAEVLWSLLAIVHLALLCTLWLLPPCVQARRCYVAYNEVSSLIMHRATVCLCLHKGPSRSQPSLLMVRHQAVPYVSMLNAALQYHKCINEKGKGHGDCKPHMRAFRCCAKRVTKGNACLQSLATAPPARWLRLRQARLVCLAVACETRGSHYGSSSTLLYLSVCQPCSPRHLCGCPPNFLAPPSRSICPDEWIEKWQELREEGRWFGRF